MIKSFQKNYMYVPLGGVALIRCVFEGHVVWKLNEKFLHHRNLILANGFIVIPEIRLDTIGLYSCYKVSPYGLFLIAAKALIHNSSCKQLLPFCIIVS